MSCYLDDYDEMELVDEVNEWITVALPTKCGACGRKMAPGEKAWREEQWTWDGNPDDYDEDGEDCPTRVFWSVTRCAVCEAIHSRLTEFTRDAVVKWARRCYKAKEALLATIGPLRPRMSDHAIHCYFNPPSPHDAARVTPEQREAWRNYLAASGRRPESGDCVDAHLNCGHSWDDVFREPCPPDLEALAFALPTDPEVQP